MRKNQKFPSFFLGKKLLITTLIIISLLSCLFIGSVNATEYEWIIEPSFEAGTSCVTRGDASIGFVAGSPWYAYEHDGEGWQITSGSGSDYTIFNTTYSDSGIKITLWSGEIIGRGLIFNLTSNSEVYSVHFWVKKQGNPQFWFNAQIREVNGDFSSGLPNATIIGNSSSVHSSTLTTSYIETIFTFSSPISLSANHCYAVVAVLDTGGSFGASEYVWFQSDTVLAHYGGGRARLQYSGIWVTDDEILKVSLIGYGSASHSGSYCVKNRWQSYGAQGNLWQTFNYLDSDTITELGMYCKVDSPLIPSSIQVGLFYSDGTYVYANSNYTYIYEGWKYLNFSSLVTPNKLIKFLNIVIADAHPDYYTYLDDITMSSTTPQGEGYFTWNITPYPLGYDTISFSALTNTNYVFNGLLHNGTLLNMNGTFSVTGDSNRPIATGVILNGLFSFNLLKSGISNSSEIIRIITTTNETNTFTITAWWNYFSSGGGISGGTLTNEQVLAVVGFVVMFFLIFVPPFYLAFECGQRGISPMLGFFGGLSVTVPIGYISGLIPAWFLFILVIVIAIIFLMLLKDRFSSYGGT